jgi:hypothetical protein
MGMLFRDLHTAKLATLSGLRFPLRLDEAPELGERLMIFLGHGNLPVQSSTFQFRSEP